MNIKRILLGGLLAGVVINIGEGILNAVILADEYQAMMEAHGLVEASWAMVGYPLGAFLIGFVLAWLYAAVRPRFGPGWQTAARLGLAVFLITYLVPGSWFAAMGLTMGGATMALSVVWGLAEMVLASVAAAWVYQEEAPPV